MKQTIIEGYLTQQKLEQILKNEESFIFEGSEVPVPDSKMRFDFVVFDKETNKKVAIEFNGYQHYANPKVILNYERKQRISKSNKIKLVEIPYWVQLTNETFKYYFKHKPTTEIIQDYPHGFIDKKALLPSAFCSLGVERFAEEHLKLPKKVESAVYESIYDKLFIDLMTPEEVLPLNLIDDRHWDLYKQGWEQFDKYYLEEINNMTGKLLKAK